jgi:heme a synthase
LTRLHRLSLWTLASTIVLVAIGGFTRGSGSGYGCADRWPLCEGGALGGLLPRADFHMIVEWTHRWVAAVVTILIVALVWSAWRRHRQRRALLVGAVTALVVILAQAGLGAAVVITHLEARELVAVHLTVAMVILGLLAFVSVGWGRGGAARPAAPPHPPPRRRPRGE